MDHNEIRHRLSEYMDDELAPEEQVRVEEHFKECSACSEALRELEKTIEQVRKVEDVEPPAWMTQKIMARVRDTEERKGLLRRIFFPLHIKLPLEALGVLFLAVSIYFLYEDLRPVERFQETALEYPAPQSAQKKKIPADGPAKKEVPQEPEYKALDMKQEYEKPKAPVPAPAPQASHPAEQRAVQNDESRVDGSAYAERSDSTADKRVLGSMKGLAGQGTVAQAPAAPLSRTKAEPSSGIPPEQEGSIGERSRAALILTIQVRGDVDASAAQAEAAIKQIKGKVIRKVQSPNGQELIAEIDARERIRLSEKLKTLGRVHVDQTSSYDANRYLRIVVQIVVPEQHREQ